MSPFFLGHPLLCHKRAVRIDLTAPLQKSDCLVARLLKWRGEIDTHSSLLESKTSFELVLLVEISEVLEEIFSKNFFSRPLFIWAN